MFQTWPISPAALSLARPQSSSWTSEGGPGTAAPAWGEGEGGCEGEDGGEAECEGEGGDGVRVGVRLSVRVRVGF